MKTYIKAYRYRVFGIGLSILLSFMAVFIISLLFKSRLNAISNQLENYHNSEYSVAYVLNYGLHSDNEFVFADTDIQLYLDENGTERLTISCLMPQTDVSYSLEELKGVSNISSGEIIISRNVADKYNLKEGDTIYVQYPYSSSLFDASVFKISETVYDYQNPIISNDIGIVYVAYDKKYEESTNCKYILFSKGSKVDELSEHSQIISDVINKNQNQEKVFSQGVHILIFEAVFLTAAMIISFRFFFSRSFSLLKRVYLKGEKHSILTLVPVIERVIWWGIPCLAGMLISKQIIPCNSELTRFFYSIPVFYCGIFAVVVWIYDYIRVH